VKIGIPKEIIDGENRVGMIPRQMKEMKDQGHDVLVQSGAGEAAGFADSEYEEAGAKIVADAKSVYGDADLVVKVNTLTNNEVDLLGENTAIAGMLAPLDNQAMIQKLVDKNVSAFSMEFLPRITRAQSMDVLSSMSTVSGYKAVLMAAESLPKFFPLLMTAAGTIPPANALVIGAGVAGLQAIASSKRLGAKVTAFDTRPAVKEQVQSLGARFLEMELEEDAETEGGYAKEMTEEFYQKELEVIGNTAKKMDVIISTALIFGKKAPILITEEMVKNMRAGSVIVDLAAPNGGNCELTEPGKTVVKHDVTILGPTNLASTLPQHASQMYSKNLSNFLKDLWKEDSTEFDFENEVVDKTCIVRGGEIRNEMIKNAISQGGE